MLSKAIRRYSLALYQAAFNENKLDAIAVDSNNLINLINSSKDLKMFFLSPVISSAKKTQVIGTIFENKISSLSFDFIKLLIQNNREGLLPEILNGFLDLKNESEGKIKAEVKTAVEIAEIEKSRITDTINNFTGKKSITQFSVDKTLVGGFTIKLKDVVIDASIKRQLENLRNKFKEINIK